LYRTTHSPTSRVSGAVGIAGTGVAGEGQAAPDVRWVRDAIRTDRRPAATVYELRSGAQPEEESRISARLPCPPSNSGRIRTHPTQNLETGRNEISRRVAFRGRPDRHCHCAKAGLLSPHDLATPRPARCPPSNRYPHPHGGYAPRSLLAQNENGYPTLPPRCQRRAVRHPVRLVATLPVAVPRRLPAPQVPGPGPLGRCDGR